MRRAARPFLVAAALLAAACARYQRLPPPPPLPEPVQRVVAPADEPRLSHIRIQLGPSDQQLLERTLDLLAADPRVPPEATREAVTRALDSVGSAEGFCDRLVVELASWQLRGQPAQAPAEVAVAVPIADAYRRFVTAAGRSRYADAIALSRAVRDGQLQPDDFGPDVFLVAGDRPTIVTDAIVFMQPVPGAGGAGDKLCLSGAPTESYLIAYVPTSRLAAPPRVPTAADGACRPKFTPAPPDATMGHTCTGSPEFAVPALRVGDATHFSLSR
ncbi:MAG TPA: hypothetical protein VMW35_14860 [Myxococcota bacterium]|nr:hypothetical protein [Myxococcota bacterium]